MSENKGINITLLRNSFDLVSEIRSIANSLESGKINSDDCTIIIGTKVYHLSGKHESECAVDAIWNMQYGIHKLMYAATQNIENN